MQDIIVNVNGKQIKMWQFVYEAMLRCKGG